MGGRESWQVGRQRQARDGCVGGRDGKWVDKDRLGMGAWVGEVASG